MLDNFWEHLDRYSKLGFDPLKWVPTCGYEVDPFILKSALQEARKSTVKLSASWFDSYFHIDGKKPELTRRVFSLADPVLEKEIEVKRALAILRIQAAAADDPRVLSEVLEKFLKSFSAKVAVTCSSAVLTEQPEAQFAMFDYIELHR